MNEQRKSELIAWLMAIVPRNYLPLSINEISNAVQCGSMDCVAEIIEAYLNGDPDFLGIEFKPWTHDQILTYADNLKRKDRIVCHCGHTPTQHRGGGYECKVPGCPCKFIMIAK